MDENEGGDSWREGRRKALRSKIQRSIEVAKEEQRRELLRRRIELARSGLKSYDHKQYGEAVRAFITYIRILEDWKGVPPGGLQPKNFDLKKDVAELLLINSVYWHLVKLYDQMKTQSTGSEFSHYIEKYILFTKGMPFQPLAAETLRKYQRSRGVNHPADLKNAYQLITGSRCFVATSLVDLGDEATVPTLRVFRDRVLRRTRPGRAFVRRYYRCGPVLAARLDQAPRWVRRVVSFALDVFARLLGRLGFRED